MFADFVTLRAVGRECPFVSPRRPTVVDFRGLWGWRGRRESDSQVFCHANLVHLCSKTDTDIAVTSRPHHHRHNHTHNKNRALFTWIAGHCFYEPLGLTTLAPVYLRQSTEFPRQKWTRSSRRSSHMENLELFCTSGIWQTLRRASIRNMLDEFQVFST